MSADSYRLAKRVTTLEAAKVQLEAQVRTQAELIEKLRRELLRQKRKASR